MGSLIGLKNIIMFSTVLFSIGSVSAQQAFAGGNPEDECNFEEYFDGMECFPWTMCDPDQYEIDPPDEFKDRDCEDLTMCTDDEFESGAPNEFENRICTDLTMCTGDEFESTLPTETSDRICSALMIPNSPIGGTVGSMSTTSLLVAGAQANMGLWSLALVGIVGAGAAITYKIKSKKTEQ